MDSIHLILRFVLNRRLRIEITEDAEQEITEAYLFYDSAQPGIGNLFLNYLEKTFNSISANPNGYKKIATNSRQAIVQKFPFVVIFELIDQQIIILAVFHTSRKPKIISR